MPVRLLFYTYVTTYWLGSFGLISGILIIILYLTRKNKLGYIGKLINKKFLAIKKSKLTYFAIFMEFTIILIFTCCLIAVNHEGNEEYLKMMDTTLDQHGIRDLTNNQDSQRFLELTSDMTLKNYILALLTVFTLPFTNFEMFSSIVTKIDSLTQGWSSHFYIIILLNSAEGLGILLYFKYLKR